MKNRISLGAIGAAAIVAGIALTLSTAGHADNNAPFFSPAKIDSFDGKSWAGLTLGETTQDGVKHQFQNGRGDFSTSVLLEQQDSKNVPFRVSALYPNKDKEARLDGICIKYKSDQDGIPLTKLQAALGDSGRTLYTARRFEEWEVVAYPKRGIILFVVGDHVPMILMGDATRVANTLFMLKEQAPPILNYADQFRDVQHLLTFSRVDVSFSLKNIGFYDQDREKRSIERDMRRARGNGFIQYDSSAPYGPSYEVSITANYSKDKGGDGSVEASIHGNGPFGPLSASDTETFKIDKRDGDRHMEDTRYDRALEDAMRSAERQIAQKVRDQQPPPMESVRIGDCGQIIDKYRFHAAGGTTGGTSGGGLVD